MARFLNAGAIRARVVDITTAGTAVQLSSTSYPIPDGVAVVVKAAPANTGNIFVGGSQSDAQTAANRYTLVPNESVSLQVQDLNMVWVDAATSGDDVQYLLEV